MSSNYQIFISCQIGFEEQVKHELLLVAHSYVQEKPFDPNVKLDNESIASLSDLFSIQIKVGGVSAKLPLELAYHIMLWTRVGARVLLQLVDASVIDDIDLYNAVYNLNWDNILVNGFDFKVNFNGTSAELKNAHYSSLRVKDAIVDYYTKHDLPRPDVNTEDPDVLIDCRYNRNRLVISLDLTGTLHKRYRHKAGLAPMRETLAANLIQRTGWDKKSPVYNPMCGSGVLAIEAAMIALNIAPGIFCEQHHLDYWQGHDVDLWLNCINQAKSARFTDDQIPANFKVYASDNDRSVLQVAEHNASLVDVQDYIEFEYRDIRQLQRKENFPTGLVIMNPPYGVRLAKESDLYETYIAIGSVVQQNFPGWVLGIISANEKLLSCLGLKASRKWKVKNSNLNCLFCLYGIRQAVLNADQVKKPFPKTKVKLGFADSEAGKVAQQVASTLDLTATANNVVNQTVNNNLQATNVAPNSAVDVDNPFSTTNTINTNNLDGSPNVDQLIENTAVSTEAHTITTSDSTTTVHHEQLAESFVELDSKELLTENFSAVSDANKLSVAPAEQQAVNQPIVTDDGDFDPLETATSGFDLMNDEQATEFYNRLVKNARRLNSYLSRKRVENYRLYDADIPAFNVAVDVYNDMQTHQVYYIVQEYAASKKIPFHKTMKRALQAVAMVERFAELHAKSNQHQKNKGYSNLRPIVINKIRERQKGTNQYEKMDSQKLEFFINEYDCKFLVNLTDYIDTGIFLDNRDLRYFLRKLVKPTDDFLNLFAYTATATVHAIKGGAKTTKSVDLSTTYCNWAARNLQNNLTKHLTNHKIIQADVLAWLEVAASQGIEKFDVVFCDPPTFSNSKRMSTTFDVQKDHVTLLSQIAQILKPGGRVIFCNNRRGFKLDYPAVAALGFSAVDITKQTMPDDFARSNIHQAWILTK